MSKRARLYASHPERFHTDDLATELDSWIAIATAIKAKLDGEQSDATRPADRSEAT